MPRATYSSRNDLQPACRREEEISKISVKAITLSSVILWGDAMLFVGLIHMATSSYGGDFLRMMSSVYPSADTAPRLGRVCLAQCMGSWMASSPVCSGVGSTAPCMAGQKGGFWGGGGF